MSIYPLRSGVNLFGNLAFGFLRGCKNDVVLSKMSLVYIHTKTMTNLTARELFGHRWILKYRIAQTLSDHRFDLFNDVHIRELVVKRGPNENGHQKITITGYMLNGRTEPLKTAVIFTVRS